MIFGKKRQNGEELANLEKDPKAARLFCSTP